MKYYAHTAVGENGTPLPESSGQWQPLATHLSNVAELAGQFAAPFNLAEEAKLAGLLHDLGKYSVKFQQRLRDPRIHGINHWSVGSFAASEYRALEAAFAIEGHHTGMPALLENDDEPVEGTGLESLKQRLLKLRDPKQALEVNGFAEAVPQLLDLFRTEKLAISERTSSSVTKQNFATALRTRLLFSCLVDADFLDTEAHFDSAQSGLRSQPPLQPGHALKILLADLAKRSSEGPSTNSVAGCLPIAAPLRRSRRVFSRSPPPRAAARLSRLWPSPSATPRFITPIFRLMIQIFSAA